MAKLLYFLATLLILNNCGGGSSNDNSNDNSGGNSGGDGGNNGACVAGIPVATKSETAYCSSIPLITPPGTPVTVSGNASYEFRPLDISNLLDNPTTLPTKPIRFAEVRVTDAAGNLIQCAETDVSGNYSLNLPTDGATYNIAVISRGSNSNVNGSVLDAPDTNNFYSVSAGFVASSPGTLNLKAEGRSSIVGGAFNIFDQIVSASLYLKTETSGCGTITGPHKNCTPYNPQTSPGTGKTAKVSAYWKKGFNPNEYFCNESTGLSFYVPSTDQLFILGGIGDDTDNSDTDHFDNSVILHEYAHFLEDQYAQSDSPGGQHNGNSVLDPRLAWSEGWANFFQAAVTTTPIYVDTSGNKDGNAQLFFAVNIEFRCSTNNNSGSCTDFPLLSPAPESAAGEGNFREFSISRLLWDTIDSDADTFSSPSAFTDNFSIPFNEIWTSFINLSETSLKFRNVGLFHELILQLGGTATINTTNYKTLASSSARHQPNQLDYPNPIDSGTSCTTTILDNGANLFRAFDFYNVAHPGGVLTLDLTYTPGNSLQDVDLYLYQEAHTLDQTSSLIAISNSTATQESPRGSESLSVTNLAAGNYLIAAQLFGGTLSQDYVLNMTNTSATNRKICPKTSF